MPLPECITPDDEDVLEQENMVKQQAVAGKVDESIAVQIHGLIKKFPGTKKIGCCKCKETPPYHAIKVRIKKKRDLLRLDIFESSYGVNACRINFNAREKNIYMSVIDEASFLIHCLVPALFFISIVILSLCDGSLFGNVAKLIEKDHVFMIVYQ